MGHRTQIRESRRASWRRRQLRTALEGTLVKTNLPISVQINLPIAWIGGLGELMEAEGSSLGPGHHGSRGLRGSERGNVHLPAPHWRNVSFLGRLLCRGKQSPSHIPPGRPHLHRGSPLRRVLCPLEQASVCQKDISNL